MNTTTAAGIEAWIDDAKRKLAEGTLTAKEIDAVRSALAGGYKVRQRLLYLHATTPHIGASLVGACVHEPTKAPGSIAQMDPMVPELPYNSVHDAIVDGWRVIHFPLQMLPFDDHEIDILGYEFILEKMEIYDA